MIGSSIGINMIGLSEITASLALNSISASYVNSQIKYEQLYVSSSITQSLNFLSNFVSHHSTIVADVGVSPYTGSFILTGSNVNLGAKTTIRLEITGSSNPNVVFYSNSTTSSYLLSVSGIQGTNGSVASEFVYNGSNWELLYAGYDN